MKSLILAIDIGTSGAKLLLLCKNSGEFFSRTESYPTCTKGADIAEHDPAEWYEAVKRGIPPLLAEAHADASDISCIGVDGISWTPVILDKSGIPMCMSPIWYDTRSSAECDEMNRRFGEETFFSVSGNPNQPYYIYPKLKWFLDHSVVEAGKIGKILTCNGYIVYRLTGEYSHDLCQAYGWCFFDMKNGKWDEKLCDSLGMDLSWLPGLCECTDIAGTVTKEAAADCGLRPGIPVVAGGLDAACGAAGAGVICPGITHEQSGSAGGMSICMDSFRPVRELILSRHVVPGMYLLQGGTVGGGNLTRWLDTVLYPEESGTGISGRREELYALAEKVPAGSDGVVFLPYMAGERSPVWNPYAKGVYYGLDYAKGRGHMVRAVLEGAAYALKHNLECAGNEGITAGTMRAVGGAAKNSLWMQIKADVTGEKICPVMSEETTALGCAIMAGVGCGEFGGFAEAGEMFIGTGKEYVPDAENAYIYREGYRKYRSLYDMLSPIMKG